MFMILETLPSTPWRGRGSWTVIDLIVTILSGLRLHATLSENAIHAAIVEKLTAAGIEHKHEMKIAPRCRVDFLCAQGVGVEVKRGKPNTRRVNAQIDRYCRSDLITALVLVTERGLCDTPRESNGKQVQVVSLTYNWGIAL